MDDVPFSWNVILDVTVKSKGIAIFSNSQSKYLI